MLSALIRVGLILATLCTLTSIAEAQGRGFVLITHGDTISHLGEIDSKSRAFVNGEAKVGYKWSYGGIFWIDFWTWDGEYCLYEGDGYEPITGEDAAKFMRQPTLPDPPFFYRFPLGLLILGGLLGLCLLGVIASAFGGAESKKNDETAKKGQPSDAAP
jgi:hypothetical protein